jgi:hypothetical protein
MLRSEFIIFGGLVLLSVYAFGNKNAPPQPPTNGDVLAHYATFADASLTQSQTAAIAQSSTPIAQPRTIAAPKVDEKNKRNVETALSAAAIAALVVAASRNAYYATGHPCACPDDSMRNGKKCGSRSAYSRPGGAAPLCYVQDVTATMIEAYRQRIASR